MKIAKKIYRKLRKIFAKSYDDKKSNNPREYGFLNTDKERELLRKYMKKAVSYLEFGSGGSTFEALKAGCKKVVSIESSAEWVEHMKSWNFIRKNIRHNKLNLRYINIGQTKEWGMPVDDTPRNEFIQYSDNKTLIMNKDNLLVFIDGRFRVACCLIVIKYCSRDTIIALHDFYSEQGEEHYQNVLSKYLDVIEKVDSLGIFVKKQDIDENELSTDYDAYKYNYN